MEAKHLAPLPAERTLAVTSLMHARILLTGPQPATVFGRVQSSVLPAATLQPAMRRLLRDRGPVAKKFGSATPHLKHMIADVASARISVAPAYGQPAERLSLAASPASAARLDPAATPWLGHDWDLLRPLLEAYIKYTIALATRLPRLNEILGFLDQILKLGQSQSSVSAASLTPAAVEEVRSAAGWAPPGADHRLLRAEELEPARENRNFSFLAWNFRQAALANTELIGMAVTLPAERPALDVQAVTKSLRQSISPYATVAERLGRFISLPPAVKKAAYDPLEKIVAHPRFDDPAYELLKKISQEYVVPNLSKIANNTITLLEVNWSFIESFMVGLNHEMARELLWRRYFTDQRGSYFRLFWDARSIPGAIGPDGKVVETSLDIFPIHGWKLKGELTPLGSNRPLGRSDVRNLVLVVRGDLLRRYPNTQVYACKAMKNPKPREADFDSWNRRPHDDVATLVKHPILFARFEPDIYCYGFDLQEAEAKGKPVPEPSELGWYFVLAERFGEPRFGLDAEDPKPGLTNANELAWGHLAANPDSIAAVDLARHQPTPLKLTAAPGKAIWNSDAADMAAILLREPARIYYHAHDMLSETPE